jgi:quinol monooxygenase YgiN
MHARRRIWLGIATLLALAAVHATPAQDANRATYLVSYIEVAEPAVARVADILRRMAQAARPESGASRYDVLQRTASPNQFAIVEVWKNQQARTDHLGQSPARALRAELDPLLVAPIDERLYAIVVASEPSPATADAVYAVAHIDILGPTRPGVTPSCRRSGRSARRRAGPREISVTILWSNRREPTISRWSKSGPTRHPPPTTRFPCSTGSSAPNSAQCRVRLTIGACSGLCASRAPSQFPHRIAGRRSIGGVWLAPIGKIRTIACTGIQSVCERVPLVRRGAFA